MHRRVRLLWCALALAWALYPACALAADMGADIERSMPSDAQLAGFQSYADDNAPQIRVRELIGELASGGTVSLDEIVDAALKAAREAFYRVGGQIAALVVPAVLLSALKLLESGDESRRRVCAFVMYVTAAGAMLGLFSGSVSVALNITERAGGYIETLFPVLTALLAACGATATAAASAPVGTLAAAVLSGTVTEAMMWLCAGAAALAVAGTLSEHFSLARLLDLFKSALHWISALTLTAFAGLMGLANLMGGGQDSATMRAAKYAVGTLIPGVGGEVADTMNALSYSAALVKNATGVTGLVVLAVSVLPPLIELGAAYFAVRLSAALIEPLGGGQMQKLADRFSTALGMLLVAASTSVVVAVALTGAVLSVPLSAMAGA